MLRILIFGLALAAFFLVLPTEEADAHGIFGRRASRSVNVVRVRSNTHSINRPRSFDNRSRTVIINSAPVIRSSGRSTRILIDDRSRGFHSSGIRHVGGGVLIVDEFGRVRRF